MSTKSGVAIVTIGSNVENTCTLAILDGPYEMNPTVASVNCLGATHYTGIAHEHGTYQYTLNFSSTIA